MRQIITVGAGLLIVTGSLVCWRVIIAREHFQDQIVLIHVGMTTQEVMDRLGEPRESKRPCYARGAACDQDLVYAAPFDFVSFWTVSLDQSGHVIDTFHWQSP
jgi:hypothetical protein